MFDDRTLSASPAPSSPEPSRSARPGLRSRLLRRFGALEPIGAVFATFTFVALLPLSGCLSQPAETPEIGQEPPPTSTSTVTSTVPERINVDALGRLPAFSHATRVGDQIFVSGTLGTKPQSIDLVAGGVGPETTQTMANIEQILQAAGSSLDHLAKCIVYLVDIDDFATMNVAWLAAVGSSPPARATIGVNELALGARVEIECTAVRATVPPTGQSRVPPDPAS